MKDIPSIIEVWQRDYLATSWSGTAEELRETLSFVPSLRDAMQGVTSVALGKVLSSLSLMGIGSVDISSRPISRKNNNTTLEKVYVIKPSDLENWAEELKNVRQENVEPRNHVVIKTRRAVDGIPNGAVYYPPREVPCAESTYEERMFRNSFEAVALNNYIPGFYKVYICVLGKQRAVGNHRIPHQAAMLFDSALFWLWGFCARPDVHKFNLFRPGMAAPELFPAVEKLRIKLSKEAGTGCLDFYTSTQTA